MRWAKKHRGSDMGNGKSMKRCTTKENGRQSKTKSKKRPEGNVSQEQISKTKREFKKICELAVHYDMCYCYLCGQPIRPWHRWNLDHVKPVALGGRTEVDNLRPVHYDCNQAKADLTLAQFRTIQELADKHR